MLLLVTMVSAGSMLFVSCKDYDDDINDLREQITTNATDLTSLVSEKVANVQTEISDLQAQSEALRAAYEAADKALQATMETSIANALASANGYADTQAGKANAYTDSKVAAANSYADAQALAAQTAAIAAAQNAVDAAAASLQASLAAATATLEAQGISIDGINSSLTSQGNSIAELQANVEALVTADATLTEGISAAQARADEAYSLAQSAQTLAETNASALESLKAVVESNNTTLEGKVETVNNAVSANTSSIESLKSAVTGLQTSVGNLDSQISVLQGDVASVLEKANGNATDIASLSSQLSSLSQSNEALKTALVTQLKDYVESLKSATGSNADAITALQKALAECESKITANNGSILTNAANIQANAEAIASLNSIVSELQGSSTGSIQNLMQTYQQLSEKVDQNQADIQAALNENVNALNSSIQAAVLAANVYADAAAADVAATLSEQIAMAQNAANAANASLEDLKLAYAAADKELQDQITELSNSVNASLTTLSQAIEDANAQISANQNAVDAVNNALLDYAKRSDLSEAIEVLDSLKTVLGLTNETLNRVVSDYVTSVSLYQILGDYLQAAGINDFITKKYVQDALEEALADNATKSYVASELNAVVEDLQTRLQEISETTISGLQNQIDEHATQISSLQEDVTKLFGYINETKRLKGLVFAPATYLGGIPCICLATLKYTDWGEDLEADAAKEGNVEHTISLDTQMEEYLLNPNSVQLGSIDSLSFVANTATEVGTRTVTDKAPIEVVDKDIAKNENGLSVLKVTLKKTSNEPFALGNKGFTIVALKADIADAYLTADEKEAGETVSVYSDWARLYETSKTPKIHNANAADTANDKLDEEADNAHFWKFTDVYGEKSKDEAVSSTVTTDHVLMPLSYDDEPYDLDSLVIVCDEEGATYDCATYGFAFEYNLIDYLVGEETESAVNQSSFAKIVDGSSIIAQGSDETPNSREAIGHTPVIQVVLRDIVNDAVVDVRYFQIQWIDEGAQKTYGELSNKSLTYECGGVAGVPEDGKNGYKVTIEAETVAKLYKKFNISEDEFYSSYELQQGLYASAYQPTDGGTEPEASEKLGKLTQSEEDHSLTWAIEYDAETMKATQDDYDNSAMKSITAWGVYKNKKLEGDFITFQLILNLEIEKMELVANHVQTVWQGDTLRVFNPQLESDKNYGTDAGYTTTTLQGSLFEGYIKNGQVPASMDSLVNKGTASFQFDDARLQEIADATGTDRSQWDITDEGKTLTYTPVEPSTLGEGGQEEVEATTAQIAAQIVEDTEKNDFKVQLYEKCEESQKTGVPTDGAKLLVGKLVPVKLVDVMCDDLEDVVDSYSVQYLTPLKITGTDIELPLYDITAGGSNSSTSLAGTIKIVEASTRDGRTVWTNSEDGTGTNQTLVDWYDVKKPQYDIEHATTNLQLNGSIGSSCNVLLSDIKKNEEAAYQIKYDESNNQLIFENKSGSAISNSFQIDVPVTIKTKWQDAMAATVHVTILPGYSKQVRRK